MLPHSWTTLLQNVFALGLILRPVCFNNNLIFEKILKRIFIWVSFLIFLKNFILYKTQIIRKISIRSDCFNSKNNFWFFLNGLAFGIRISKLFWLKNAFFVLVAKWSSDNSITYNKFPDWIKWGIIILHHPFNNRFYCWFKSGIQCCQVI